jgi:putative flavoprotein involved in K+ transport
MRRIDTVVIGAGHAGLATSRCLADAGRDHVVLERGRLAESWRSERWDSLRLLTPNWMTRLPGRGYQGPDPDGFMRAGELVDHLAGYARSFGAPVREWTSVLRVSRAGDGYQVTTDQGAWSTRHVVVATGPRPWVPEVARRLGAGIRHLHSSGYRNPDALPGGGVLVVGASSSGVQLAAELRRSGRHVVLAVGEHTRMPRTYRGMDIMWWLERTGVLARTIDDVSDPGRARREPSLQLAGGHPARDLDLGVLARLGVVLTGRLAGVDDGRAWFAGDLPETIAVADARLRRTLAAIDAHVEATGLRGEVLPAEPVRPVPVPGAPGELDLRAAGITTVLWATGHRNAYPWLRVPVLGAAGEIRQSRGATPSAGLYVIGLRFLHRRDSSFIGGARHDARAIVGHIATGGQPAASASRCSPPVAKGA